MRHYITTLLLLLTLGVASGVNAAAPLWNNGVVLGDAISSYDRLINRGSALFVKQLRSRLIKQSLTKLELFRRKLNFNKNRGVDLFSFLSEPKVISINTGNGIAPKRGILKSSVAPRRSTGELVPFDGEFATKQLLGVSKTPGGKQINFHAADRMVNPPKGRVPMSAREVEDFIDTANGIKKIRIDDRGTSVTLLNSKYPKAQIAVDGKRIITVVNPKRKK